MQFGRRQSYTSRKSMTMQVVDKTNRQQNYFAKVPLDAIEIRTERENQSYRRKQIVFIFLDTMLMIQIVLCMVFANHYKCVEANCWEETKQVNIYMMSMVFVSYVLDWRTLYQIRMNYINRRMAFASTFLDCLIFGGAIWEIAVAIKLS